MNASLLGGNAKPAAPAAPAVAPAQKGNGVVIGATVIFIIVLCVVIYWFWFRAPTSTVQVVDVSIPTPASTQPPTQGTPPAQPPLTIPAATQPPVQPPPPPLQGPPPVQPSVTIPGTPSTTTPMSMTPTPVSTTSGGVTCAAPNPSNIPTGTYLGKCCNCGMGIDASLHNDPTVLTCDCQTPFNTVSHTSRNLQFCGGRDIYVDERGLLNC